MKIKKDWKRLICRSGIYEDGFPVLEELRSSRPADQTYAVWPTQWLHGCGSARAPVTAVTQWSLPHATAAQASRRQLSEGRDDERNQERGGRDGTDGACAGIVM
jgi:hypothetical protein